nr:HEPN domain-containing protein [Candidatus Njordarchaeota archaeon]
MNQEFYKKCKAFVISALASLRSRAEEKGQFDSSVAERSKAKDIQESMSGSTRLPYKVRTPIVIDAGSGTPVESPRIEFCFDPRHEVRADPRVQFMIRHSEDLKQLPEFSACLEVMRRDPTLAKYMDQPVGIMGLRVEYTAESYLFHLLRRQIRGEKDNFVFKQERFDENYIQLESFFYSSSVTYRVFAPLHNFSSDIDEIELRNGVLVRRITVEELDKLHHNSQLFFDAPYPTHVAEMPITAEKLFGKQMTERREDIEKTKINRLLTGMRLFKTGAIGFNIIEVIHIEDEFINVAVPCRDVEYKRFRGPIYTLTSGDINNFKEFWSRLRRLRPDRYDRLGDGLRLFVEGYDQDKPGDKLTKFMSGLEVIFLGGVKTKGIGRKLAGKASQFMCERAKEKEELRKLIRNLYDKRCGTLHVGRHHGKLYLPTEEDASQAEEMLRNAIKKFLSELETNQYPKIVSRIDRIPY